MSRYSVWVAKPRGYRYGSWLILYGTAGHVVGFSTACWVRSSSTGESRGLWTRCDSTCRQLDAAEVPGWLGATRVLACVGMVLSAIWLLIGCPCKCVKNKQQHHKRLVRLEEASAVVAGCFGILAAMVYGVKSCGDVGLVNFHFDWSFWLHVAGAFCTCTGGILVAVTRIPTPSTPKPVARATARPSRTLSLIPTVAHSSVDVLTETNEQGEVNQTRRTTFPGVFSVFLQPSQVTVNARPQPPPQGQHLWAVPQCWTEDRPPPVYSVSAQLPHTDLAGGARLYELSLSPPPSYQACALEPPPPYDYAHYTILEQSS